MDSINFLNLEYIYLRIFDAFKNFDIIAILNTFIHWINTIKPYTIVLTVFLLYIFFYSIIRLRQVEKEEERKFHSSIALKQVTNISADQDTELNDKWLKVQTHINSDNPAEWRLAILEADIMLGDILEKMGYQGDSIGDKLKSVDKSDFLTLDSAWDAHRVRNQIAHEGADFQLNEREAKRVIELYKKVFGEFYHL
ncbi:MAG: hypothetical protein AAB484_00435 [Patescibacteria group bacterium]